MAIPSSVNKNCPLLTDDQIKKGIFEYLARARKEQSGKSQIDVMLDGIGSTLSCPIPLDDAFAMRILRLLEPILQSQNKFYANKTPSLKFVIMQKSLAPPNPIHPHQTAPAMILPSPAKALNLIQSAPMIAKIAQPQVQPQVQPLMPILTSNNAFTSDDSITHLNDLPIVFSSVARFGGINISTVGWPNGIIYIPDFISTLNEDQLYSKLINRSQVEIFKLNSMPTSLRCLADLLYKHAFISNRAYDATVIRYEPGQGAPTQAVSGDLSSSAILSLGSNSILRLRRGDNQVDIPMLARSLIILSNNMLRDWTLEIPTQKQE